MDPITEQLSQLMELSDEQLAELERTVLDEFENNEQQELSSAVIEKLESLAGAVESVRSEQSRRVTEREAFKAKAAEAAARVRGSEPVAEEGIAVAEEGAEASSVVDGGANVPVDEVAPVVDGAPAVVAETEHDDELTFKKTATDPQEVPAERAVQNPVGDVQDTPAEEPAIDTPAPIVQNPDIMDGKPVKKRGDVPTSLPSSLATEEAATVEAAAEKIEDTNAEAEEESEAAGDSENTSTDELSVEPNNTNPEAAVTASAGSEGLVVQPPADRLPKASKAATTMSITAGADIPSVSAGSKLSDMGNVAEAFVKRLHTLRHVNGGDGEQHIVASLNYEYPEDRKLDGGNALENMDRIDKVAGQAVVAAAGICLPLETSYDMNCDIGVTDRPVRDSLARFAADRGGIRYFSAPQLTDFNAATGYWKRDNSTGLFHTYGPDGVTATNPVDQKPCLEVSCPTENTAYISAVTLCLTFSNLTGRVWPELVKRQNELALVQHARIAENNLLGQIEAGSTKVTLAAQTDLSLGAAREIFNLLARAVAAYRFKNRMSGGTPLRLLIGSWVREVIRADIAMQMPGDGLDDTMALADAKIDGWFRSRGVNVTWHLDGVGPSQSSTNFAFPGLVEFGLWAEGTWLYLDGGTLDLGIIRDSSLVATNQYKQFVETFEGVVNLGCGSYWIEAPLVATGQAASLVDTRAAVS